MIDEEQVKIITKKVLDEEHLLGHIKIFEKEHNLFRGSHDKINLPEDLVIPEKIITKIIQTGLLGDLEDVEISSPLNRDSLQYDALDKKWKNFNIQSLFIDDFEDGARNSAWTDVPNNGSITEADGVLTLALADGIHGDFWGATEDGPVCTIDSTFKNLVVITKLNSYTVNDKTRAGLYITDVVGGSKGIHFGRARRDAAPVRNGLTIIGMNAEELAYVDETILPIWLRIRAQGSGAGSTMYFDYSTDGENWTTLHIQKDETWSKIGLLVWNWTLWSAISAPFEFFITRMPYGPTTFLELTDTPANYEDVANKIVKVNATPDALIFGADISDLEDVDSIIGQAGKYAKVKAEDAGIEWVDGTGGGPTTFLCLTDTPAGYAGHSGKFCKVNVGEDGLEFAAVNGGNGAAGPVKIFDSDFDNLDLGNIHGKGAYSYWGTWVNASGADCTAEIVADGDDGRMLRLDDQSGANECHASLTLTEGLYAEVLMGVVEWKVRVSALGANSRGYFNIQDKDVGATEQGGYFRGDSTDVYYRSSSGQTGKLVDAVVDTWYVVRTLFNRLGYYGGSVWWVDTVFKQGSTRTNAGNKFDKLVLSTRDIYSGNVFDIKYVKVWSLNYVQ